MESLKSKYASALQAIKTLETLLKDYQEACKKPRNYYIIDQDTLITYLRDAAIQRFEYSFEVTWKYLKCYLEQALLLRLDVVSPSHTFRQCFKSRLITEHDVELALAMVEHRNLTTHTYLEPVAERVMQKIPDYAKLLKRLLTIAKPQIVSTE